MGTDGHASPGPVDYKCEEFQCYCKGTHTKYEEADSKYFRKVRNHWSNSIGSTSDFSRPMSKYLSRLADRDYNDGSGFIPPDEIKECLEAVKEFICKYGDDEMKAAINCDPSQNEESKEDHDHVFLSNDAEWNIPWKEIEEQELPDICETCNVPSHWCGCRESRLDEFAPKEERDRVQRVISWTSPDAAIHVYDFLQACVENDLGIYFY